MAEQRGQNPAKCEGSDQSAANFHGNQAENAAESGIRCGTPDEAGAEIVCCGPQPPLQEVEHTDPGVSTTAMTLPPQPETKGGVPDLLVLSGAIEEGYEDGREAPDGSWWPQVTT